MQNSADMATRPAEARPLWIWRLTDTWAPATDPRDREFLRDLALLGTLLFVLTATAYLATATWTLPFPRDKTGLIVGRDFLNLWMYGRAALEADPARFYDIATYNAELFRLLGSGYPGQNWPNPPTALLVMAPFGMAGFFPALFVWMVLGPVALAAVHRRLFAGTHVLPMVLVSPAALLCVMSGQSSFLTAAALIGAFFCWDRRPLLAGVLIGLVSVKPQLGILIPFALIASARWKVFAAATVTTVALIAASVLLFGAESWTAYLTKALPLQRDVLADPSAIAAPFHATVFMNLRGLIGNDPAMALQIVSAAAAAALVLFAFSVHRTADPVVLCALLLACTQAASPYMSTYDLLGLTMMALVLLARGQFDETGRRLAQLVFWMPMLQLLFGSVQLPGPGFIAPAFAIYLLSRLGRPVWRLSGADRRT